ncbi:hypothetical protein [Micromonospora sp. NPDC005652]|uniref:hypothetical protein n=1 Tax=Micromonospora sp. NPDC005652 TaxID=3157046 RepID=UPI003411A5BE
MTEDEVLAACAQPNSNVRPGARDNRRIYATDADGNHHNVTDQVKALCRRGLVVLDGDAFTTRTLDRSRLSLTA